jgi:hypothetical protein
VASEGNRDIDIGRKRAEIKKCKEEAVISTKRASHRQYIRSA